MRVKKNASYIFSGIMVILMLFIVVILVHWAFFSSLPLTSRQYLITQTVRQIQNWQKLQLNGQRSGPLNAPVHIVEFFDYECPYCKASEPAIKAMLKKYPKKVAVIYENFPLDMHPYALMASIAAECADKQNAFIAYHDSLFANQARLGHFSYIQLAARAGVTDTAAFHRCLKNRETAGRIQSSKALGDSLGIRGTPTFIINDTLVVGELSIAKLDKLVQDALSEAGE